MDATAPTNAFDDAGAAGTQQYAGTIGPRGTPNGPPAGHTQAGGVLPPGMLAARRWLACDSDKVPYYIGGGRREGELDSPADLARLATFEEAQARLTEHLSPFKHLGFALGPDGSGNHWQGIDLDNVPQNCLSDLANELPSYVELSPSSKGCHAIGYGRPFETLGSNGTGVEAYARGRYFTVTGNAIRAVPLVDLADYVEQRLAPRHNSARPASAGGYEVETVTPQQITELRSALNAIPADDRHVWVAVGMALKTLGESVGWELWATWSQRSTKWDPKDAADTWDSFVPTRTGYAAIFTRAQSHGWVNPASNAAQIATAPSAAPANDSGITLLERLRIDYTASDDVEVPDLIEGLVADEEPNLLGGHGGIGKSFLSLQIAMAVAAGAEVLGKKTRGPKRVLYYCAEDSRKRVTRRMRSISQVANLPLERLRQNLVVVDATELDALYGETMQRHESDDGKRAFFNKVMGPTADYGNLAAMVQAYDPDLLVVDGASDTFAGREIDRVQVKAFMRSLMRLQPDRRIAVLVLVHIDRNSARGNVTDDDGYSGSSGWHNACRRRMYLLPEKDGDGRQTGGLVLKVMKNQVGKPMPDLTLARGPDDGVLRHFGVGPNLMDLTDAHLAVLVPMIDRLYKAGRWIAASFHHNVANNPHKVLSAERDYPKGLDKKQLERLINVARSRGQLETENYRSDTGNRTVERLLVSTPEESEP